MRSRRTSTARDFASWQNGEESWCLQMSRNFVFLGIRADEQGLGRMRRTDLAPFENKNIASPMNRMVGKAGEPDPERDKVAQGQEPEMANHRTIMHHPQTNLQRNRNPEHSGGGKNCPRPPRSCGQHNGDD